MKHDTRCNNLQVWWDFIGNLVTFPVVKNLENWLRFDAVTAMSLVAPFL